MSTLSDGKADTQLQGELEHRRVKRFYSRTNKNKAIRQMTSQERREQALIRLRRKLAKIQASDTPLPTSPQARPPAKSSKGKGKARPKTNKPYADFLETEALPYTSPEQHHHISMSRNRHMNYVRLLSDSEGDPAVKVC